MTEKETKELAIEYIDSCTKKAGFVILAEQIKNDFIDLFVAGFNKCLELEAGKPKWHKVADGDLPKYPVQVLSDQGALVIYKGDCSCWFEYSPNEDNIKLRK